MTRSRWFRVLLGLLVALAAAGCTADDPTPTAQPLTTPRPNPPRSLDTGIGWLVDVFDDCFAAREGDLSTPCLPTEQKAGTTTVSHFRQNGTHLIVVAVAGEGPMTGGWSSKRIDDDTTFVTVTPGLQVGVIALDGDDEAAHVDIRGADGTLLQSLSLAES